MLYEKREVAIRNDKGEVIFKKTVAAPPGWSDTAVSIVASKYLAENENGIDDMLHRVCHTIAQKGEELGYFNREALLHGLEFDSAEKFEEKLKGYLYRQEAAFNSPVYFNVGVREDPMVSACFITGIEDNMESIMEFANLESRIFKMGGGLGGNLSRIRSRTSRLSGGGIPSGPVSFMEVYDSVAGVVKSGGKTRRAALMLELEADHKDILDFIKCKKQEEEKARALRAAGLDTDSVKFQNVNISVQLTDRFMEARIHDNTWEHEVFEAICDSAWSCGDPGVQFIDRIEDANPCEEEIHSSNPCGEFLFIDESACNLASINLLKFVDSKGMLIADPFREVIRTMIIAQDILVSLASYPSEKIKRNSLDYRPLGLGFSNLGSCLIRRQEKYGSKEAQKFAKEVARTLQYIAIKASADLAKHLGPFPKYEESKKDLHRVLGKQVDSYSPGPVRNAQLTLVAPTGTISFMMDCDTFGIEPEFSLVKYKNLIDGGVIKTVNREAADLLESYGYIEAIEALRETGELKGIDEETRAVLATAMDGLIWKDHLMMMAAVQPHISGAISKTINMPKTATKEDIGKVIEAAWEHGLKSVTIYRDGSKGNQPLTTKSPIQSNRTKMPETRKAVTHKFSISGHDGYVTVGLYDDGSPGELFVSMSKEGSTLSGLLSAFSISVSLGLQCGVPLNTYIEKFSHYKFEPSGITKNKDVRFADSIIDYIFRWMKKTFCEQEEEKKEVETGEVCQDCGRLMTLVGACYLCPNCGTSGGCS